MVSLSPGYLVNFTSPGYFHKIFGMQLQKVLLYLCTKKFVPPLLYFSNYNLSTNGQIISLLGAPVHLQTQLLRAESYWRLFIVEYLQPNKMKKKSNLILHINFPVFFFTGEQYIKTPLKVSMKVQRIAGALSRMSI